MKLVCYEKLVIRKPYLKFDACLNILKKVANEVFPNPDLIHDILENEARNHEPSNWKCDWLERVPKECEGKTVEECIREFGEFELREWCFENHPYKYGIEVDCGTGKIYAFYCEEE